jgi:putative cell wall-binding protein
LAAALQAPVLLTNPKSLPAPIKAEITRLGAKQAIMLGGIDSVTPAVEQQLKDLGLETKRIDGADRFAVSANVGQALTDLGFEPQKAIIASGLNFPDALSASSPAGQYFYPILQVSTDKVPASVEAYIKQNGIRDFVIVGGSDTVSDNVLNRLKTLTGGNVDRVGGANRFAVGVNLIKYFFDTEFFGMDPRNLVVANGMIFSDALPGGPLAANRYAPILLTTATKIDASVTNYLQNELPDYYTDVVYILGGTDSVSTGIQSYFNGLIK